MKEKSRFVLNPFARRGKSRQWTIQEKKLYSDGGKRGD
jgi:hypothetical protein